jgi:hypothetical protein
MARPPTRETVAGAAHSLRRVLDAVERGDLKAVTPQDRALLRRLEGALAAWEATVPPSRS